MSHTSLCSPEVATIMKKHLVYTVRAAKRDGGRGAGQIQKVGPI